MHMFPVSVVLQMLEQLTAGQIVGRQILEDLLSMVFNQPC